MKMTKYFTLFFLFFVLTACAAYPSYPFPHGQKRTKLYLFNNDNFLMCKAGKVYTIRNEQDKNYVLVPVGGRISVGYEMYFVMTSGNLIHTSRCTPFISFIPSEGVTYIARPFGVKDKCYMEVVRQDNSALNGVSIEPSLARSTCRSQ